MTTLETMYAPQANSPATTTIGALSIGTVQFDVLDADILPAAPMLLVLGGDTQNAETVLMTAKSGNTITVTRAIQGTARSWASGTQVARLFTAKDHTALIANIQALNSDKLESITAAQVVTGAPGTDAAVEIIESGTDVTIKFTIPQGADGTPGQTGDTGPAGPNEVSAATATSFNGLLKGNGSTVAQAVAGEDYEAAGTAASAVSTHNTAEDAHSTLFAGKAEVAKYNATLTTTYAEDSNGYQAQTVSIAGLLATDEPTIDCVLSGTDKDADTAILEAFSLINRATTGAGTLTVQCIGDAPTVAIPITLQVVR